jgi:hypothetical protein
MSAFVPNIDDINKLEADILTNKWQSIKYAIDHSGEKGLSAEYEVFQLLRGILPNEYGLATGFIIYHETGDPNTDGNFIDQKITKQLDIIIYDAIKCAPLIRLGACDVVPLEAVYGYVEIKGCLYKNKIKEIISDTNSLRKLRNRLYYRPKGSTEAVLLKYIGQYYQFVHILYA